KGGRSPVISDGFDTPRPGYPRHGGVDIMFKRQAGDEKYRAGSPNGSKGFVMPDDVRVLAAADGVVWSAMHTSHGNTVVIHHDGPFQTFYTHLDHLFVQQTVGGKSKQRVRAGQPIGTVGFSPLDRARLKHLHFELWREGTKIDPAIAMASWKVIKLDDV